MGVVLRTCRRRLRRSSRYLDMFLQIMYSRTTGFFCTSTILVVVSSAVLLFCAFIGNTSCPKSPYFPTMSTWHSNESPCYRHTEPGRFWVRQTTPVHSWPAVIASTYGRHRPSSADSRRSAVRSTTEAEPQSPGDAAYSTPHYASVTWHHSPNVNIRRYTITAPITFMRPCLKYGNIC